MYVLESKHHPGLYRSVNRRAGRAIYVTRPEDARQFLNRSAAIIALDPLTERIKLS